MLSYSWNYNQNTSIFPLESFLHFSIPKSKAMKSEKSILDFQPIALLNVEVKLFFSLISKRLISHLVQNNKVINLSVKKKSSMEKVPDSSEHLSIVSSVLKEARAKKSSAALIIRIIWIIYFPSKNLQSSCEKNTHHS